VSAAAEGGAPPRRRGFDRPRFLWVLYGAMCAYLFVPILVVMVYSFNSSNSLQVFGGLSTRWYRAFWNDPQIKDSLVASLEVAAVTMVVATILGTLLAFGLVRARGRIGGSANILMLLPLITPEIVTAVGLLLLFSRWGATLSLKTIILGHITFSISYVTVIVRARLSLLNAAARHAAGALPGDRRLGAARVRAVLRRFRHVGVRLGLRHVAAARAHLLSAARRRLARDQRRRHHDDRNHPPHRPGHAAVAPVASPHRAAGHRRPCIRMSDTELTIALSGVVKRFGEQYAVKRLDLDIAKGSFFSILGPSGCGKTTTLRMIAGFEQPDEGHILLEGQPVEGVPPYRRNVNTVFQSYALFEHLSIEDNIAFGLRRKKVAKPEITRRVGEMLELVRLADRARAKPRQLSGGQRQRVALARALVNLPAVLLLDEPLGALDLQLRKQMQLELKHIQREVGITFVYVTHDQEEALTMSDSIAVMNLGELQQVGNAEDVYERPANSFVAQFIGISNLLEATAERDGVRLGSGIVLPARVPADIAAGSEVCLSIRPEKLALGPIPDGRVGVEGTIVESVYMGTVTHYVVEIAPGARMIAVTQNTEDASDGTRPGVGSRATLSWRPEHALVLAS
jgi:spermidine/putrescine transport system ATP-binding protein